MGSGGALLPPQYRVQGGTTAEIKHLKHFHRRTNGGSSQVIDQEFSKTGPNHGSGTMQNEANSEPNCEISVRVQF